MEAQAQKTGSIDNLVGAELDYWVARTEGMEFYLETRGSNTAFVTSEKGEKPWERVRLEHQEKEKERYELCNDFNKIKKYGFFGRNISDYSSDWEIAGPMIEAEGISLVYENGLWTASVEHNGQRITHTAEQPLVAAMRTKVAASCA